MDLVYGKSSVGDREAVDLLSRLIDSVARFWRWWLGELAGCLPNWLRVAFGQRRRHLRVTVSAHEARFVLDRGGGSTALGRLDLGGGGDAARQLVRRARPGAARVSLELPAGQVLRRVVELPAAAAENLRQVLGFEMDRHTPFQAAEVYFDYRVVAGDRRAKEIKVDLVVAAKAVVDQGLATLRNWDLAVDRVGPAGDDGALFNLLPASAGRRGAALSRRFSVAFAVAAGMLAAVAVYLPLAHKLEVLALTEARLTAARSEAVVADGLQQRVDKMVARGRFVVERKRSGPTVTALIAEVSTLLPDHTWLMQFAWRADGVRLSGYSARPSSLIGLLEQSALLSEVAFSSPVTMDQRVGLERFNLSAAAAGDGS